MSACVGCDLNITELLDCWRWKLLWTQKSFFALANSTHSGSPNGTSAISAERREERVVPRWLRRSRMSIRVRRLPARALRSCAILSSAGAKVSSPLEIQPYPARRSPAGRICPKSSRSTSAFRLPANTLPTDLAQASALSPILIVQIVFPLSCVNVSTLVSRPFFCSSLARWLRISSISIGCVKPFSVPTTGSKPTPQPCSSSQNASTTSWTVSTLVNAQLNMEASRRFATAVPPSHRVRPDTEPSRFSRTSRSSSSSSS